MVGILDFKTGSSSKGNDAYPFIKEYFGLAGSPTRLVKIETPKIARKGTLLYIKKEEDLTQVVTAWVEYLEQKGFLA
ncbi:MAG: hypothetical protein SNJ78_13240 [Spirochaetales bacterium]